MVREACVIVVDNSECSRNGDFSPTRLVSQVDAAHLLCGGKLNSSPETTVALMSSAGDRPTVHVTLTDDMGKVLSALAAFRAKGESHLLSALQVAKMVLKHRQDKSLKQRIIIFVCSPIQEKPAELKRFGGQMRKQGVAIDIVSFGTVERNHEALAALHEGVDKKGNTALLEVQGGILADQTQALAYGSGNGGGEGEASGMDVDGGGEARGGGGGAAGMELDGLDPSLDPELVEAIRASRLEYEEGLRRQQAEQAANPPDAGSGAGGDAPQGGEEEMLFDEDDDEALQQALAMSMMEAEQFDQEHQGESAGKETPDKDKDKDEKADESSSPPSEKDGEQEE